MQTGLLELNLTHLKRCPKHKTSINAHHYYIQLYNYFFKTLKNNETQFSEGGLKEIIYSKYKSFCLSNWFRNSLEYLE